MKWHAHARTKNVVLRHPTNSTTWKTFDAQYGTMFCTMEHNHGKTTQNNGVSVSIEDGPTYYNKLAHIIEVRYYDGSRYVLFKCDWANIK
jgi:hypothetical protein